MTPVSGIRPDWPAPPRVKAFSTTRLGGVSKGPWSGLNLGLHVGDQEVAVLRNRALLREHLALPSEPQWLQQQHGVAVRTPDSGSDCADASVETRPGRVCAVMTADCLPVLLCNRDGTRVAAAHAGWRGLCAGVIEAAVRAFDDRPDELLAWLGPAIGPAHFEVGAEVRQAFVGGDAATAACFLQNREDHWLADLYGLARHRLSQFGIEAISGGEYCTFSDADRFYSYRRDGISGRMATLIWLCD